jgi:hypothetical protein
LEVELRANAKRKVLSGDEGFEKLRESDSNERLKSFGVRNTA